MAISFEGPRILLEPLNDDINQLEELNRNFLNSNKPREFVEFDQETGDKIYKIKLDATVPRIIINRASAIAKAMKDTLDQAIFAACTEIAGRSRLKGTHFPYANKPQDLKDVYNKDRCKDIPSDLHNFIDGLCPYPSGAWGTGNDLLWSLCKIAGPNKHQFPIVALPNMSGATIRNLRGEGVFHLGLNWDVEKQEMIVAHVNSDGHFKYGAALAFAMAFTDRAAALANKPVIPVFRALAGVIHGIVGGLEAETSRITGR